jgi:hypothetical protein
LTILPYFLYHARHECFGKMKGAKKVDTHCVHQSAAVISRSSCR